MLTVTATGDWYAAHRGGHVGLLEIAGIGQPQKSTELEARKRETEARLRDRYQGFVRQDFNALPVIAAYAQYYRRFGKTYHVQLQLESIVLKGKSLPSVSPLVDANFAAELETLVLTAGHDVAKLAPLVTIDVSRDGDEMVQMNGTVKALYAGDMIMRDAGGVACSVIYGQDNRSPISPATSHVLYVAYAPAGVGAAAVEAQLRAIEANVRLFCPLAALEQRRLIAA
jgi:DNA/RNA-binding domain of Phe-tRNA-synthetase-like protein